MNILKIGNLTPAIPIVQGGMGVGISLNGLASAVANEGGIGVISAAGLGLLYRKLSANMQEAAILGLKTELEKARAKTKGIIGVNIMVAMTNFSDMVKTAIASKADIIFSGAGLPMDLPSFLEKDSRTKLVPIVSSARAVKLLCEKWKTRYDYLPDAFVLEGPKAGGHLGYKKDQIDDMNYSLEELLPQVLEAVKEYEDKYDKKIPVIAGGGIYTGEDIYKIISMGASGVQMGSIFVTTEECDASQAFKQSYIDARKDDVVLIDSPVGMPGRAIFNNFLEKVKAGIKRPKVCPFHCIKTCDISKSPYCIMTALYQAFRGDMKNGYAFAGSNAYLATKITTVKETISGLMQKFEEKKAEIKNHLNY